MSKTTEGTESDASAMFSRQRVLTIVLMIATAIVFYLCWLIAQPFLPSLAWALALTIVGMPMHRWIRKHIKKPTLAACVSVFAIAVIVVAPAFFVAQRVVVEAVEGASSLRNEIETGAFRKQLMSNRQLAGVVRFAEENIDLKGALEKVVGSLSGVASSIVTGSVSVIVEMLIMFFCLFFFFRDHDKVIKTARELVPLARRESERLFRRLRDTVQATVFGTLVVAMIQGALGGLMFWWLGLPLPLLWGVVMGLLAIVPILGAFVIWVPAAVFLVSQGQIWQAVVLTIWGTVVIGLVDNLLYPVLVGNKLRLHTLPVFFSIVGGLFVFGASGLIIGPVVLAVADALVDVWRARMDDADEAEEEAQAA